jgi:hypothetical protein
MAWCKDTLSIGPCVQSRQMYLMNQVSLTPITVNNVYCSMNDMCGVVVDLVECQAEHMSSNKASCDVCFDYFIVLLFKLIVCIVHTLTMSHLFMD